MSSKSTAAQGCWTCRLRRKKCSGEKPNCSKCILLNVTCYGYGNKPMWMDGGAQEKERLNEIRKRVKLSTDSQRRQRALRGQRSSFSQQNPVSKKRDPNPHRGHGNSPTPQISRIGLPPPLELVGLLDISSPSVASRSLEQDRRGLPLPESFDPKLEPFLLMHYLDVVFPSQFPFYKPSLSDGGRGWMLCLLQQAKPLYNAALCLAAHHQNLVLHPKPGRITPYNEQDHFYSMTLRGLRKHLATLSSKDLTDGLTDSIEILACVSQLIMFEVARGGTENWYKHLMATPDIFPFLRTYCTHPDVLEDSTVKRFPRCDTTKNARTSTPILSFVDHAAMEFYSGVIIWLDILGAVSTGMRPQYADICTDGLGDSSKLQLKKVMGCENWAMVLIREIAVLSAWKRQMSEQGILSILELGKRAGDIERRLVPGIDKLVAKLDHVFDSSNLDSSSEDKNRKDQVVNMVTHAFACAAKVYLYVTLSGPNPDLPEVSNSVSATAAALKAFPDSQLITRKLVWPFCIAGCMAKGYQRQAFRHLASSAGIKENVFGSSWRAFEAVQTCWDMHDGVGGERRNCDWLSAMKALGYHVLLV